MQFAKRDGVAALEVAGGEAAGFLNDLLTAQIANLEAGQAQAACLLTPQGRILFDMMVFCVSQERFWLQLPADEINAFQKRLMMYRLRRPVEIKAVAHWQSAIIFDSSAMLLEKPIQGAFADPRDGLLGWHIVSASEDIGLVEGAVLADEADWHRLRIQRNVPEGATDLIRNRALMLEAGLDHLNAVDFSKGCYIGQEVTARTHYRGLVKRRIVPVQSATGGLAPEMDILRADIIIGQILSCSDDAGIALAHIRLDALQAHIKADVSLVAGDAELSIHYPEDLPPLKFAE